MNLKRLTDILTRAFLCGILLILGWAAKNYLASLKKPPTEAKIEERALRVKAVRVQPEDVPVSITGYGEIQTLNVVSLAPEVSGIIVEVHPRLDVGEIIPKGELLFKIDARDYEAQHKDSKAKVEGWENSIQRMEKQLEIERRRLQTLRRTEELAKAEYERVRRLFEKDQVGTRSGMDAAEQAYNASHDQADLLQQSVDLYPIQIREAKNSLASANAMLDLARTNLDRCALTAPFNARLKAVSVEVGQYVAPGSPVLTLADDSLLEIHVPLDSRDARQWLRFDGKRETESEAWFSNLNPVACKIHWTEDNAGYAWTGQLDRVVEFNQQTRTLTVAVRIAGKEARSSNPKSLPLVEGMFCSVEIPGRPLQGVFRLPHWAVSFENTLYKSVANRLVTVPVEVARTQGEETFVSSGLQPGDIVITTRLIDPLEGSLLEFSLADGEEDPS